MGLIYKITNQINGKIYIGQTIGTLSKRWREHCFEASNGAKTYYLYQAMRKYGIENFNIEQIEQCSNDLLNEREIYWITKYNSYEKGYNLTPGGNGADTSKHSEIFKLWDQGFGIKTISEKIGYDRNTITKILSGYENYTIQESNKRAHTNTGKSLGKSVLQLNKNTNEVVAEYESLAQAVRATGVNHANISVVCNKKPGHHTAGGFKWKWKESENENV